MKTVIQVWTQNCSNLRRDNYNNYWGIGDLIRGTIKLYQLSKKMNFRLIVNIKHHPISFFLKQTYIDYEDLITQNINNILFITPNNVEDYINNSSDNIIYFLTNDLCDENNISEDCKNFIKDILTPNDELYNNINSIIQSKNHYEILHLRTGDVYIKEGLMEINTIDRIYKIIDNNYKNNDFVMCDSSDFKYQLKHNRPQINILELDIGHIGYETDLTKIKNTLIEFFIITYSSKIKTFSVYYWISGYVYWISKIYNIELISLN
jgi:hypothetical protein